MNDEFACEVQYSLVERTAVVIGCETSHESVDIQDTYNEFPVVEISRNAFINSSLSRVSIPSSIEVLRRHCFEQCPNLEVVEFASDSNLMLIESKCFSGCIKLRSFSCPDSVVQIESEAFSGSSLETFDLTESSHLTSLGNLAFRGCSIRNFRIPRRLDNLIGESMIGISKITNNDSFLYILDESGILMNRNSTIVVSAFTDQKELVVPDSVEFMLDGCLENCWKLEKIIFGAESHIKELNGNLSNKHVFVESPLFDQVDDHLYYNNALIQRPYPCLYNALYLNTKTKEIRARTFQGSRLKCLILQKDCQCDVIGEEAFANSELREVVIDTISNEKRELHIKSKSFYDCPNLDTISFSEVESMLSINIGVMAFALTAISEIWIPPNVSCIQDHAFKGCKKLRAVLFQVNSRLERIGSAVFEDTRVESIMIPESVTTISPTAFYGVRHVACAGDGNFEVLGDAFLISKVENSLISYVGDDNCDVVVPERVSHMMKQSFYKRTLGTVSFEEGSMGKGMNSDAFCECSIEEVIFPATLTVLEGPQKTIQNFSVEHGNPELEVDNDMPMIITTDNRLVVFYYGSSEETTCTVPYFFEGIGAKAFAHNTILESVTYEEGPEIRFIENEAFANSNMRSIALPSVEKIGRQAFAECKLLYEVNCEFENGMTLPENCWYKSGIRHVHLDNVQTIGPGCFRMCTLLNRVEINQNVGTLTEINNEAFSGCWSLKGIELPESVEKLGERAFMGSGLESIAIPEGVITIEKECFAECKVLSQLKLSSGTKVLGMSAFRMTRLTEIVIPDSCTKIDDKCFSHCYGLKHVQFGDASSLQELGSKVFALSGLEEFTVPKSVTKIGSGCFKRCNYLQSVTFEDDSQLNELAEEVFAFTRIQEINIPKEITRIQNRCFSHCESLDSVIFSDDSQLEELGEEAFAFTGIKEIMIPKEIVKIGNRCFMSCLQLRNVMIDLNSSMTEIVGKDIFMNDSIQTLSIPNGLRKIPPSFVREVSEVKTNSNSWMFVRECNGMKYICDDCNEFISQINPTSDLVIPSVFSSFRNGCFAESNVQSVRFDSVSGTTALSKRMFAESMLQSIHIPDYIQIIDAKCFYKCGKLENVVFGNRSTLSVIKERAFANTSIHRMIIPASVMRIGSACFNECRNLEIFEFHESTTIKKLDTLLFCRTALKKITIPSTVTHIQDRCFYECGDLHTVVFNNNAKTEYIGKESFAGTGISILYFPKSLEIIDDHCFSGNRQLTKVLFPPESSLTTLGEYAFSCTGLEYIFIPKHVNKIGNSCFGGCHMKECTFEDGSSVTSLNERIFDHLEKLHTPQSVKEINSQFLRGVNEFHAANNFIHKDKLLFTLGHYKLIGCLSGVKSVMIPMKVEVIESMCFANTGLMHVEFEINSNCSLIEKEAFRNTQITQIRIPRNVEIIKSECFAETSTLKEVVFEENSVLMSIGKRAFANTKISSIKIPRKVHSIGYQCFGGCVLTELQFETGSGIRDFTEDLLDGCTIQTLYIPANAQQIAPNALMNVRNVKLEDESQFRQVGPILYRDNTMWALIAGAPASSLSEIVIPAYVKEIPERIFRKSAISSVSFDAKTCCTAIRQEAFHSSKLTSIVIPRCLTQIERRAFQKCVNLSKVTFEGPGVLNIGEYAFDETPNLLSIRDMKRRQFTAGWCAFCNTQLVFDSYETSFVYENGYLYRDKRKSHLLGVFRDANPENPGVIDIGKTTSLSIGENCFRDIDWISSLHLGDRIEHIEKRAFMNIKIDEIRFPKHTRVLDNECFAYSQIHSFRFARCSDKKCRSSHIGTLPAGMLEGTRYLRSITIPPSVERIEKRCFFKCADLEEVIFPERSRIKSLGAMAFCFTRLHRIKLPKALIFIDNECFKLSSLEEVEFYENSELDYIGEEAFKGNKLTKIELLREPYQIKKNAFDRDCCVSVRGITPARRNRFNGWTVTGYKDEFKRSAPLYIPHHVRITAKSMGYNASLYMNNYNNDKGVVKRMEYDPLLEEEVRHKYHAMQLVKHPGVVKYTGLVVEDAHIYISSEYLTGMRLTEVLEDPTYSETDYACIVIAITVIMKYMEDRGIQHGMLELKHIFIDQKTRSPTLVWPIISGTVNDIYAYAELVLAIIEGGNYDRCNCTDRVPQFMQKLLRRCLVREEMSFGDILREMDANNFDVVDGCDSTIVASYAHEQLALYSIKI